MASGFNDLSLNRSDQATVKLPKGFGASDAVGTVVELITNNRLGDPSIYLEMFNKRGSADVVTKKTAKNFLKYIKKNLYDNSIFHRSDPGFVLQGGGFSAPLAPADQGGSVDPINAFKLIKNEPGNSNLRGTLAMAKQAGKPDSATSQWFVNLEDNLSLNTQNDGFTAFGKVLGEGMKTIDQLASTDVFNFGGVFGELPLWQLAKTIDGTPEISPDDFLIVASMRQLKSKSQPFTLSVESSDDSLVEARVTKKQQIKLKTSDTASGTAQISVEARSTVDGSIDVDRFDVVIGGSLKARATERSLQKRRKSIDVFVDAGSLDEPFYRFFDSDGDEFEDFKINVKKKYRFHRLDQAESHPFYIGDSGYNRASTSAVKIKGDGGFSDGITGSDVLKFEVRKSDRKTFKKEGELSFFCTSHASMIDTFSIKGQKVVPALEPVEEMVAKPVINEPVVGYQGGYYRMTVDAMDQFPLI